MKNTPVLKLNTTPTNALHTQYQDLRSRFRLVIRHKVAQFKERFPRKPRRFVPTLDPTKFTDVDPGCPDLVMHGLRDDVSFGSVHWALSGLYSKLVNGKAASKVLTLRRHSATSPIPWIREIMAGGLTIKQAKEAQQFMTEINALVRKYRELHEGFLIQIDVAEMFNVQAFESVLGEHLPADPMAGLPKREAIRHLRVRADEFPEDSITAFEDEL